MSAVAVIREDLGRQLDLASNRQNTMIQIIGIIMAFASLLLIECVHYCTDPTDFVFMAALVAFLICCMVGTLSLWQWKNWELLTGSDIDSTIQSFNDGDFFEVQSKIIKGIAGSYDQTSIDNYVLKRRISYMVIFLLTGLVLLLIGLVIR